MEIQMNTVSLELLKERFSEITDDMIYKEEIEKLYSVLNKAYGEKDVDNIIGEVIGNRFSDEGYGLFMLEGKLEYVHKVAYILY